MSQWQDVLHAALLSQVPVTAVAPIPIVPTAPIPIVPAVILPVVPAGLPTAVHSSITLNNVTPVTILASDPNRRQMILYNTSGQAFIRFGTNATDTVYTMRLSANEMYTGFVGGYTGVVTAIRGAGSGVLQVTDITL